MNIQHYIHCALGFSAKFLTKEQSDLIWSESGCLPKENQIGVWLVPFTGGYEGKNWATIVVKSFGEIDNAGKMTSFESITNTLKDKQLSNEELVFIKEKFAQYGISHLVEKIHPIIYSETF